MWSIHVARLAATCVCEGDEISDLEVGLNCSKGLTFNHRGIIPSLASLSYKIIMLSRTLPSSSRTAARSLARGPVRCAAPSVAAATTRSFASTSSSRLAEVQDAPQPKKRQYGGLRDQDRIFSNVSLLAEEARWLGQM